MQITVLSVTIETKPTKTGKTYQLADVAFKDDQGKVSGKKVMSFGATERAFKALANDAQGKTFEVESVKNAAGYWDWTNLTPSSGASQAPQTAPGASVGRATTGSTYATAEERAKVQIYIVKQSCLAQAVATLSVGAKAAPATQEVLKKAQEYVDFVFDTDKPKQKEDNLFDLPNDFEVE